MIGAAGLVFESQLTAINKVKGTIKNIARIRTASNAFIFFTMNPSTA